MRGLLVVAAGAAVVAAATRGESLMTTLLGLFAAVGLAMLVVPRNVSVRLAPVAFVLAAGIVVAVARRLA